MSYYIIFFFTCLSLLTSAPFSSPGPLFLLPLFSINSSVPMNSSFSPFPIDLNEHHNHNLDHFFSTKNTAPQDYASSSFVSTSNYPIFISPSSPQLPYYHHHTPLLHPFQHQYEGENVCAWHGGPLDHPSAENFESGSKISVGNKEEGENSCSVKWMSSKMRIMRKMMNSDQTGANKSKFDQDQKGQSSSLELDDHTAKNHPNTNNSIRVCADCNTTKTPLWRSGPRGPKSLCNACGIRQRKARRALAAAQESENGEISDATNSAILKSKEQNKDVKRTNNNNNNNNNNRHLPLKKRCKFTAQAYGGRNKKLCVEDLSSIILSKINNNSAFQQVLPQDEKEAAILLMALSYGLVRG